MDQVVQRVLTGFIYTTMMTPAVFTAVPGLTEMVVYKHQPANTNMVMVQ